MTKAGELPYQLRPNKYIDRQLFLELLTRVLPQKKVGHYVYISMGGKHLVDHEAIYRKIGIKNLFSFDGDGEIVRRQNCNKPIRDVVCEQMMSGELPEKIEDILRSFHPASNVIVWLDFTKASERLMQLEELVSCLQKAQSGDVFRITMNAQSLPMKQDHRSAGFASPPEYRAHLLREQIGDFFPAEFAEIQEGGLPQVLAHAVRLACSEAERLARISFEPLLLTQYADGQRMFTATILARANSEQLPVGVLDWEFRASGWGQVYDISVPDLSLKERAVVDQNLHRSPSQIIRCAKFVPGENEDDAKAALRSYKQFHRFYPAFSPIAVS